MADFLSDLRFGARMLRKRAGTSALAAVALALGIGLTTTMFSVVNGVFLRGLPFERANQLLFVGTINTKNPGRPGEFVVPDFLEMRSGLHAFEGLAAFGSFTADVADPGDAPRRYDGERLTPDAL